MRRLREAGSAPWLKCAERSWLRIGDLNRAILCLVILFAPVGAKAGTTVAQAIKLSQQTGKPIFAVAGASYCPACKKLMKTLDSDKTLQPFIREFVPLKIDSTTNDYELWKQFFPPKRSAIPALFIVTPKGEELYSAVGALPTERLQRVLLSSLEKAKRYPGKSEWQEISQNLKSAEKALDARQVQEASQLLQPVLEQLQEMGSLLELEEIGINTVKHIQELASKQQLLLEAALQSFKSRQDLVSALDVAALENLLAATKQQRKLAAAAIKKHLRLPEQRKLLRQAREFILADALAKQSDAKSKRKALIAYKRIAKRFPDTDAAKRALKMVETLESPESPES